MKKSSIFIVILTIIAVTIPVLGQEIVLPSKANKAFIEDNLIVGLNSGNAGLQRAAAFMLGKLQSTRAVDPLVETLYNDPNEKVRTAAAWALCKIGDSNGLSAVRRSVERDLSKKVQLTNAWYYETFVKKGTYIFKTVETVAIAQ
jgi:hypothetical protein